MNRSMLAHLEAYRSGREAKLRLTRLALVGLRPAALLIAALPARSTAFPPP